MAQILRTEKLKLVNKIGGSELTLFDKLNLFIEEKDFIFYQLPHGAGKTILFKLLLSQTNPTSGKIIYNNKEKLDDYDKSKFIKENITAVGEFPTLVSEFNVKDWTRFQIELIRPVAYKKRLEEYYEFLENEGLNINKRMNQLTLLEIRKLELTFSVLSDSILIIADDIDIGLNKEELAEMGSFLKKMNKFRAIFIISSNSYWSQIAKKIIR